MAEKGGEKAQRKQGVLTKRELDTLWGRLAGVYGAGLVPPYPFPILQVAQARAWHGHRAPDAAHLSEAIRSVHREGVNPQEIETLIVLTEVLFRPLRAVELELERQLPDLFSGGGYGGTLSEAELSSVRRDFFALWNEKAREVGTGWVLAASRRPLSIVGKPSLVAPKVTVAVVAERLEKEGVSKRSALDIAAALEAALLGQAIQPKDLSERAKKIKHWRERFRGVQVRFAGHRVPLTQYLARPLQAIRETDRRRIESEVGLFALTRMNPSDFVAASTLPVSVCADFANLFWRRGPEKFFACQLCEGEEMSRDAIWRHLADDHHVPETDIVMPEQRSVGRLVHPLYANELLRRSSTQERTQELLAKWRNGPLLDGVRKRARTLPNEASISRGHGPVGDQRIK